MPLGPAVRQLAARLDPEPDAALVRRFVRSRDQAAFAELVGRHSGLVLGVCRRALGHAHDAEDAAQAVFLVLARSAGRLRNEASVAAWLHGVAVRVCRKALARRAKRPGGTGLPVREPPPAGPPADEAVAWQDARRAIDDALAALPDALRRPLVLCYLQGLTRDEAAARLGWSPSTFRGRLERGRDRLRADLVRRGFPLSTALLTVPLSDAPAAPGWAAATARAVASCPAPEPVSLLASGVLPIMNRWLYLVPAGVLAAGLVWAAGGGSGGAGGPAPSPDAPAARSAADPNPGPPPADLRGRWTAEQTQTGVDGRRDHVWEFVDAEHLTWGITVTAPGVRTSLTLSYRYVLANGVLTLTLREKRAGEEKLTPAPGELTPRTYSFVWDGPRKAGFRVVRTDGPEDARVPLGFRRDGEPAAPVPPKPPTALLTPDPKAGPVGDAVKGYWAAEQVAPNGDTRRDHAWRFVDDKHLVWVLTQAADGLRVTITTKYRYELKDGTLALTTVERWAGVEKLAPRKGDDQPRVFGFAWDGDRAGFRVTAKEADPQSPWRVIAFRKAEEPKEPPDPLVPESLTKIDRPLKKEPEYADTPLYLLLAVGPEAKFKVWVVLAGAALYVDRNGNGDLTEDGEAFPLGGVPGVPPDLQRPAYNVPDLRDPAGPIHTDLFLGIFKTNGNAFAKLGMRVGGTTLQTAGPTDLRLAESPTDAQVLHFGSKVVTVRPSKSMPSVPDANKPVEYRVQVGTPGVGPGSFVSFGNDGLADGVGPVAEFALAAGPGAAPGPVRLALTDRCCGDQFYEKLTVPDGAKAGLDAATVTLSFPGCPWGEVKPATYTLDVIPKRK